MANNKNELEFLIYGSDERVEVLIQEETIWATQKSIAELFGVNKSSISRHLKNIYESGELKEDTTVAKFATVASFDSSPSSKIFFKCLLIVDLLTPNNSAIAFCDSQTDSSLTIALTETSSSDER